MTTPSSARPGPAPARARTADARRARGTGLLAAALAATTALATLGAVPSADAQTTSAPLSRAVVGVAGAGAEGVHAAAAAVVAAGGTVLDRLPLVGGVSADLPTGSVLAPGLSVVPDRPVQLAGAAGDADGPSSTVRETLGLGAPAGEGAGLTIAVVDTGVAAHPDLAGRLTSVDVSGAGPGDGYGHGTFVAGIAAGSGASSGGRYAGVAPGAHVLDVRVADDDGTTDLVTVLRGLEAARSRGADVVNLSLSSYSALPWQVDPLTVALTELWRTGTVVVVPAGNDGPDAGTVTSPGVAPALLTVGALDEARTAARSDDAVAAFSARGPAPQDVAKPELVAPGRSVVSLRAAGSAVDVAHSSGRVGEHYFTGSGTSFSTAVAAGAAAVLRAERTLSPHQVKVLLTSTAYTADGLVAADAAGAGGLDLAAARTAPAPAVVSNCPGKGKGASCERGRDAGVPGPPGLWQQLLDGLVSGDAHAAASSWSRLSAHAEAWMASSWSSLPADLREELTAEWAARNWAGGSAEQWAARNWAARNWAARNWAASSWSARNWAASSWSARNWAASSWSARNWAASSWSARNWAAVEWGA
jgi:serine protease AprX